MVNYVSLRFKTIVFCVCVVVIAGANRKFPLNIIISKYEGGVQLL